MKFPRPRVLVSTILAAVLAAVPFASAQQAAPAGRETSAESVAKYTVSEQMPIDPEVAVGKLPNGLRYYVRPNAKPPKRAELRLVVKAGSVLEDDDQRGLAQVLEALLLTPAEQLGQYAIDDHRGEIDLLVARQMAQTAE